MQYESSQWSQDINVVLRTLESRNDGLSHSEARERFLRDGKNEITMRPRATLWGILFGQLLSPLIVILLFAGGITLYLEEWLEAAVIFIAVAINVALSTYQEYGAERTIAALQSYIKNRATVVRDGKEIEIDASELVVGDIIRMQFGTKVPADVRIIESSDVTVDESILTGESLPVHKHAGVVHATLLGERTNMMFAGTYIVGGNATALVTAVGDATEFGKIAASIVTTTKATTPVQDAVKSASWYIFLVALVIVVGIFILGVNRGESVVEMLILSAAVAVGAVPEALPITLTVILSLGVARIAKRGGLVSKLEAAETLGSTTLILSDKTGTLTHAELSLDTVVSLKDIVHQTSQHEHEHHAIYEKEMLARAYTNIEALSLVRGKAKQERVYTGSPFEIALLKAIHGHSISDEKLQKGMSVLPFNSTRKYSASYTGEHTVFLGAPDILIGAADANAEMRESVNRFLAETSAEGKRLVGIAQREGKHEKPDNAEFLGVFVLSDRIRDDVKDAIAGIEKAGVSVKVISGDMPGTVQYIARKVGIDVGSEEIITGDKVQQLSDEELLRILPSVRIFARVTPEDKQRIGKLYQQLGEVVAMTGDGVNDAPALKAMNVGVALGSGTDVAKSAADIILLENSFTTITDAIHEGRIIKANIRKVFVYLMSTSLDEVFVIAGALISGLSLPLTALQIIWVNLLTGTLPALAFAHDTKAASGTRMHEPIFSKPIQILAIGVGALSSLLMFALYFVLDMYIHTPGLAQSVFFLCFSLYILAVSYSFVDLDKNLWQYRPFTNKRLNRANILGFVLVFITAYNTTAQSIFGLVNIPLWYLSIVLVWCVLNIFIIEVAKFTLKKYGQLHA